MIFRLKDKYYWYFTYRKLKKFLGYKSKQKILMYGYPKSGNTWLRFLLFNYRNLLINPAVDMTLTYDELNRLQNNVMDRGTIFDEQDGFPIFYRTHKIYVKPYNLFSFKVFIHRNPMDTLISSYYFYKNRNVPFLGDLKSIRHKLHDIDFYVRYKLDSWIQFYYESLKHADIIINYSDLKEDSFLHLSRLIEELEWDFNIDLIKKSVEISSLHRIKKMEKLTNQQYGNGPKDGSFKGEFTRSGEEGQFTTELKVETIDYVLDRFPEFINLYPDCLE